MWNPGPWCLNHVKWSCADPTDADRHCITQKSMSNLKATLMVNRSLMTWSENALGVFAESLSMPLSLKMVRTCSVDYWQTSDAWGSCQQAHPHFNPTRWPERAVLNTHWLSEVRGRNLLLHNSTSSDRQRPSVCTSDRAWKPSESTTNPCGLSAGK